VLLILRASVRVSVARHAAVCCVADIVALCLTARLLREASSTWIRILLAFSFAVLYRFSFCGSGFSMCWLVKSLRYVNRNRLLLLSRSNGLFRVFLCAGVIDIFSALDVAKNKLARLGRVVSVFGHLQDSLLDCSSSWWWKTSSSVFRRSTKTEN